MVWYGSKVIPIIHSNEPKNLPERDSLVSLMMMRRAVTVRKVSFDSGMETTKARELNGESSRSE